VLESLSLGIGLVLLTTVIWLPFLWPTFIIIRDRTNPLSLLRAVLGKLSPGPTEGEGTVTAWATEGPDTSRPDVSLSGRKENRGSRR